jgi:HAD superfamily hydrolase (TIGR01509 family)
VLSGVIFDFDGVLADTEPLHLRAYQDVIGAAGLRLSREDYYSRYLGYDDVGVLRALAEDQVRPLTDEEITELIARKTARYEALVGHTDVLFPGAADLVRRLAAEAPLAIASGALLGEIDIILERAGLKRLFHAVVAAGDTARGKPAPDPYLRAVELLEVGGPGPGVVVIEDSRWGIESAHGAGLRCIAVAQTYPAHELEHADLVVQDIAALTLEQIRGVAARPR